MHNYLIRCQIYRGSMIKYYFFVHVYEYTPSVHEKLFDANFLTREETLTPRQALPPPGVPGEKTCARWIQYRKEVYPVPYPGLLPGERPEYTRKRPGIRRGRPRGFKRRARYVVSAKPGLKKASQKQKKCDQNIDNASAKVYNVGRLEH